VKLTEELNNEIEKHSIMMDKVFKNIKLLMKEKGFTEFYELALSYYKDSIHFRTKNMLVQSFEALIISWAYIDAGLKLDILELTDDSLKKYFTIE